jgi:hypothetical protein
MKTYYPTVSIIGRFVGWCLGKLRSSFFGIGGMYLLVVAGLYIAGVLVESLRWYLVGIASALLLLGGGLLALSYARFMLSQFVSDRYRSALEATLSGTNPEFSLLLDRELDVREKQPRWMPIKNLYKGRRAFLIGNGPSLNKTPLHLLNNEYTLCFNRFDLMFERLAWRPTMYMCADDRVAQDTAHRINEIVPLVKFAFFPDVHPGGLDFRDFIKDADNVFWLSLRWGGFYDNLPRCGLGGTVSHAGLQVLAFMGFSPICLIGVDMEFKRHQTVIKHDRRNWTATQDDDPNHFDPRYFGSGAKFHYPRLHEAMLPSLQYAKEHLDEKGVKVLNAGIGGSLEVFPRVDFRSLFDLGEEAELEMLLSAVPSSLQANARDALRNDRVVEKHDSWNERSPFQVTTLRLAQQLIPKVIFTHIPYGPLGNRYLFIMREKLSSATATKAAR